MIRIVHVDRLQDRFDDLPTGAWDRPPHQAIVVPITAPSGQSPYGLLVAGVNPYCLMDDAYRDFVDLVAAHIAAAVTDNGDDGQGFGARTAWLYVILLSIGYMISRGLAKSGSRERYDV